MINPKFHTCCKRIFCRGAQCLTFLKIAALIFFVGFLPYALDPHDSIWSHGFHSPQSCPQPFPSLAMIPDALRSSSNVSTQVLMQNFKAYNPTKIESAWSVETGCSYKFFVEFQRPSRSEDPSRFRQQPDKLRFLWKATRLRKGINEALAFALDTVLNLERTPAVFLTPLPMKLIVDHLDAQLKVGGTGPFKRPDDKLHHCNPNYGDWYQSLFQPGSRDNVYGSDTKLVLGSSVSFVKGVESHFYSSSVANHALTYLGSWGKYVVPFSGRERGTRVMYDFLLGNDDRIGNEFSVNGTLVYIDQDAETSEVAAFSLKSPIYLGHCKVHFAPYTELKKMVDAGVFSERLFSTFKSIILDVMTVNAEKYPEYIDTLHILRESISKETSQHVTIINAQRRGEMVVQYIESCIKAKGHYHVFCGT